MRRLGMVLGMVMGMVLGMGCALAVDGDGDLPLTQAWPVRPVKLRVSEEMPGECVEAVMGAVEWYRERGASFEMVMVPVTDEAVSGGIVIGSIGVWWEDLEGNTVGHFDPVYSLTTRSFFVAGRIQLEECQVEVAAHEMGHALGLRHVAKEGNLMHATYEHAGMRLNEEQLDWIVDGRIYETALVGQVEKKESKSVDVETGYTGYDEGWDSQSQVDAVRVCSGAWGSWRRGSGCRGE